MSKELKKIRISWTLEGNPYEAFCWIPREGPNPMKSAITALELTAECYEVAVEEVA